MIGGSATTTMKTVLFLCTGNYYRSRFAEILFNHLAAGEGVDWRAVSAGLHVQADGVVNVGPMSVHTIEASGAQGLPLSDPLPFPRQVSEEDLKNADITIALKEAEHRKMMREKHPAWEDCVRYWHVHDLDAATPEVAMVEVEALVRALLGELKSQDRAR